ncbi:uncharacterized protein [Triticum aestivum]|uniref:uncharacterized protein n=1 Tax=Triticum aestivum TaxID=4565 RepID=UPI001D007EF8|nr:uncharacterized protein LOC123153749 [Triticum aestivum]
MGHYGVLEIDTFPKKHKEQAMQLLMSVIPEQSCLSLDTVGLRTVDLNADVWCRILGTRKGGSNEIQVCSGPAEVDDIKSVRRLLKLPETSVPIKVDELLKILVKEHKSTMEPTDKIRFQRAFAMLYVTSFVGPREHLNQVTHSACQLVLEHEDLTDLNWGKYTVDEILVGATEARARQHMKTAWVYGCPLVLMVLFFDSVDVGFIKLDERAEPRIKYYNASLLEALVNYNSSKVDGLTTYGMLKPKKIVPDLDYEEGEADILEMATSVSN